MSCADPKPTVSRVRAISGVALVVFVAALWLSGETVAPGWLRWLSLASLAAVAAHSAYERWLWAVPPLARLTGRLDLRGTWKGTLRSQWTDPDTGKAPGPKPVYLVVRQTATNVQASLLTDESRSSSTAAGLEDDGAGPVLSYVYFNQPALRVRARSEAHSGGAVLHVSGSPPSRLHSWYWTDRDSKGELDFDERKRPLCTDYEEARGLF